MLVATLADAQGAALVLPWAASLAAAVDAWDHGWLVW
jgi:hypothetical protein